MTTTRRVATAFGLLSSFLCFTLRDSVGGEEQAPPGAKPPEASDRPLGEPQFPNTYGPLDASRDAYERAERERRKAIDRQLQLNEEMVWYSTQPGYDRYPPSLATIYGYGRGLRGRRAARRAVGPSYGHGHYGYPSYAYPSYAYPQHAQWGVFEPWPFVPGDVYGYPYLDRVEQPLGHKVIRTGPNSYIYRPVYESDLKKESPTPAPPQIEPAEAVPEPIPTPPLEEGPREF